MWWPARRQSREKLLGSQFLVPRAGWTAIPCLRPLRAGKRRPGLGGLGGQQEVWRLRLVPASRWSRPGTGDENCRRHAASILRLPRGSSFLGFLLSSADWRLHPTPTDTLHSSQFAYGELWVDGDHPHLCVNFLFLPKQFSVTVCNGQLGYFLLIFLFFWV